MRRRRVDGSSTDALLHAISEGLKTHDDDPVAWLTSFVEGLAEQQGNDGLADRSELPSEIAHLAQPPVVLVADCGTGETKLLLYKVQAGSVHFEQLTKLGPAAAYVDKPEVFVDAIKAKFAEHKADLVLVAASAWMRGADAELVEKGNALLQQLADAGVICKTLDPREEGWLELAAAEYACEKLGIDIDASWAAGGGSTQMTQGFAEVHPHAIGNQQGLALLRAAGAGEGLRRWREQVRRFYDGHPMRLSGVVLGMSAVSHAAKACGLPAGSRLSRQDVLQGFDAFIARQSALAEMSEEGLLDLANVAQQRETLDKVVAEGASFLFFRDVEVDGATIRITWSLGWYLELLAIMGMLAFPRRTLRRLWEDKAALKKIGSGFSDAVDGAGVSAAATGQVLRDLERAAEVLRGHAAQFEPDVTAALDRVAEEHGARLEGGRHRIKTGESLQRKLKVRLRRLLEKHRKHRFYYPRLSDVFHEVDDALRYTLVIPEERYTQVTEVVLLALGAQLPCTSRAFNYWTRGSTYRGINAFITYKDFTFELQFHTEASWQLKQQASHQIYEGFRALPPGRAKYLLYQHMKTLWDGVPMPRGAADLGTVQPMRDPLMEQLGSVLELKRRCADAALPILDGSAFSDAAERESLLDGLCCRLIRGREAAEFETLAHPPQGKRLAWVSKLSEFPFPLAAGIGVRDIIASQMGKPVDWVDRKLAENYRWKLVVMPAQVCVAADWDGVLQSIQSAYPEVANKVLQFGAELKARPFRDIEAQIDPPDTFRGIKDGGEAHQHYVDLRRLRDLAEPAIWQVRAFLYIVVGLNELFSGDGFLYDEAGAKQGREYLLPNRELTEIPGCEVFAL